MRILEIVPWFPKSSGVSVYSGELSRVLVEKGCDITLAIGSRVLGNEYDLPSGARVTDLSSLCHNSALSKYQVAHIHGLWCMSLHKSAVALRRAGVPIVWSPHGMLTPWALKNRWYKKVAGLVLYQYKDLKNASLLHATSESEEEDIRRLRLKNPIIKSPLGVSLDMYAENGVNGGKGNDKRRRVILFVSRVQRKKGLRNLLLAYSRLPADLRTGWRIKIAGPDEDNHTSELIDLCLRIGIREDVEFLGPIYGNDKNRLYQTSDVFVLPTYSENFGSVVIESLAAGTPVICTKGAPWQELETYHCGKWIDIGVPPLSSALCEMLMISDKEREDMGARGRELVTSKYTWTAVGDTMLRAYEGISS